jgi:hypothetical protein
MRKILTALVAAATIGAAAMATSGTAQAQWRRGWGPGPFIGGLAAGAIIGGALAARPYYYSPYGYYGYYGYGPYPYRHCPLVWNGYAWVRACY